jgi:uncharacterized protein (DUF1501 family)
MTTRRDFLKTSSLIALGPTVPSFLGRTAFAAPPAGKPGARDTILVVIQLTGGNDGLNTVIPYTDETYKKLRPTLAIPKDQVRKIDDAVGLHPAMEGMAGLLQDQALCVVQAVGYPNPSQSHFDSMDYWQAARTRPPLTEGWIGRALKQMPSAPAFHIAATNESAPLALAGAPVRAPSLTALDDFQVKTSASGSMERKEQKMVIEGAVKPAGAPTPNLLDFVQRTAVNTYASSDRLREIGRNYQAKATYPPTALANRLKLAAQLIDAGLGARIFYVTQENYDTHAGQANSHRNLLAELSGAVTAFYKDLAARGQADRICLMTFSEFGRRARENGSKGTDHGSGAPMFLVGGKVKAGAVGKHPSLTELEMGNLKHAIDFRQVYAAVLDQWLGVNSQEVLGPGYTPVEVFKA